MMYKNHFSILRLLSLVVAFTGCVNMNKNQQNHLLVGEWHGKIPETSAYLIFNRNGQGSISYSELKRIYGFEYTIKNDSIVSIKNRSKNSEYIYVVRNDKLKLLPLISDEETIDIISEIEFKKVDKSKG